MVEVISWVSSLVLVAAFFPQIWKNHLSKEVKDLSPLSFWGIALGSLGLAIETFMLGSMSLFVKQLATMVCALIILGQIKRYSKNKVRSGVTEARGTVNAEGLGSNPSSEVL